ncbi:PAS domain S-box protein, partial [bacterium]|nr:PAS domain S-box protein [bacterium]
MPSLSRRALILVAIVGILYWTLDAVYLYVSFQAGEVVLPDADGPSLLGVLATDVPRHALAGRLTFLASIVLVALVALTWQRTRDAREDSLLRQLESAGDLFSRHDLDGRYLYASAGYAAVLGVDPERLRGRGRVPGWTVLNREELEAALEELGISDHPVAVTTRLRHEDGREIWLESVGRRVQGRRGDEIVVVSRDVTARHRAEEALAASEHRLRLITENMQEILWLRVGDRLHYINSAVERIFGVPGEQLGDRGLRSWLPWMHPDDRERVRLAMDQALDHHEPLDEEFRIVRPDGQVRWLHARTVHVETDHQGQPMTVGVAADVTGRRRAEDAMRASAARYRTLYDAAHVGITITDLAGGVIYANRVAAELFGATTVTDLLDHARREAGIRSFFREPSVRDEFVRAMQDDERGRASRTFAMRRLDGREVQLRVSCGLITNPESGRQEILAILEDVTERQRAERELRRSEERYRRLVDFLPDGILVHDRERVILGNPACAELLGVAPADLPGMRLGRLVPDASVLQPVGSSSAAHPDDREGWLVRRDGTRFPAALTSLVLHDGDRRQILTVIKDLTGIRRAGDEIAAQQAILSALIETMPLGILAKDLGRDLRYVIWNRYMEEELGLSKADVIGRQDRDIFPEAFAREMRRQDQIAASGGEAVDLGEVSLTWNGDQLELRAVKVPVRDAEGRVSRIFTIVENVTQQKRLHASLQQSRRMEAVGRLAAAVAHDFNNMLQVVRGYTESIQRDLEPDHELHEEVLLVLTAVERASELVHRLLAYSRYDSIDPELVDVNLLCENALTLGRSTLGQGVTVDVATARDLPRVYADPRHIEQ